MIFLCYFHFGKITHFGPFLEYVFTRLGPHLEYFFIHLEPGKNRSFGPHLEYVFALLGPGKVTMLVKMA